MLWSRFAGSNRSRPFEFRNPAARGFVGAGIAAMSLVCTATVHAQPFSPPAGVAGQQGVVIGDYAPGDERSVMVPNGASGAGEPFVPAGPAGQPWPEDRGWGGEECPPALVNRALGPACPRWVGQADVLLLWQGNVPSTPLLTLDADPFPVELAGNQLPYVMGTGPRTAVLFNIDRCHAIEANYFNAGNFSSVRNFTAPEAGSLAWAALGNYNIGDIIGGSVATAGRIQSFELNWRKRYSPTVTWLAGFRWIEWNDSLTLNDSFDNGVDPAGTDSLSARSGNDLYGGQLGLDALLLTLFESTIRFNGVAKAGVYGNPNASTTMTVDSSDPTRLVATSYTANGSSTGFFGEVGVNGAVRLSEHLYWRAGYNFFWISGVATSLNQLGALDLTDSTGKLNLGGSVFLHGVNTGIELVW